MSYRRIVAWYLLLLLLLAALGGANQLRFRTQVALMDEKQDALAEVVELRAEAARVQGPRAVTSWAERQGMIPAPENERIENVAPMRAPRLAHPETGLEVRTVWR